MHHISNFILRGYKSVLSQDSTYPVCSTPHRIIFQQTMSTDSKILGLVLIARHGDREGFYQDPTTYTASATSITPLGVVCTSSNLVDNLVESMFRV